MRAPLSDNAHGGRRDRIRRRSSGQIVVAGAITGVGLAGRRLLTGAGPIGWGWLALALGSRPNDFAIPGLAQRRAGMALVLALPQGPPGTLTQGPPGTLTEAILASERHSGASG